jgi:hypothetical protein
MARGMPTAEPTRTGRGVQVILPADQGVNDAPRSAEEGADGAAD